MKKTTKTALVVGGGVVGAVVIAAIAEHYAHASPAAPSGGCTCPNGTPCPNGDVTQCPQLGTSLGPSSNSGQTYNYNGSATANLQAAAQALAAVDPCNCANVAAVRAFQLAAGLTVNGSTDGRYGSNTQAVLANLVPNAPAACATQSWWGAPGTYTNPNCAGDPGP